MGITPLEKTQQKDSLDQETRNQIWSMVQLFVCRSWGEYHSSHDRQKLKLFYERAWVFHFKLPLDDIGGFEEYSISSPYSAIKKTILSGEWYKALNLLEYIVKNCPSDEPSDLIKVLNNIFESENVGYRIINKEITPITHPIEIKSVEDALSLPIEGVRTHLQSAISLISSKTNPDYRNSIKESISAVEAICKVIANDNRATLGTALAKITNKHPIPGGLNKALGALYGYTSNEGGIRHALTEDEVMPTFADAKFMLVSCTAFVNYLLTIAAEENISLETTAGQ